MHMVNSSGSDESLIPDSLPFSSRSERLHPRLDCESLFFPPFLVPRLADFFCLTESSVAIVRPKEARSSSTSSSALFALFRWLVRAVMVKPVVERTEVSAKVGRGSWSMLILPKFVGRDEGPRGLRISLMERLNRVSVVGERDSENGALVTVSKAPRSNLGWRLSPRQIWILPQFTVVVSEVFENQIKNLSDSVSYAYSFRYRGVGHKKYPKSSGDVYARSVIMTK